MRQGLCNGWPVIEGNVYQGVIGRFDKTGWISQQLLRAENISTTLDPDEDWHVIAGFDTLGRGHLGTNC